MRRSPFICLLLLTLSGSYLQAQETKPDQIAPRDYSILYTGRLLGYARIPEIQELNAPNSGPMTPEAHEYLGLIETRRAELAGRQVLLLGMGDNFAPRLGSRIAMFHDPSGMPQPDHARDCVPAHFTRVTKDQVSFVTFQQNGHSYRQWVCWQADDKQLQKSPLVDYDNVAQFFIKAGYNALVPGKHDFYFGAARLQQLAAYLEANRVAMLGANLVITTTRAPGFNSTGHPRIPDAYAGNQHPNINADFGPTSLSLPKVVLPWKTEFVLSNARALNTPLTDEVVQEGSRTTGSWICAASGTDPWAVPRPDDPNSHCFPLRLATRKKKPETTKPEAPKKECEPKKDQTEDTDVKFVFKNAGDKLLPGQNHLFCTHLTPGPQAAGRNTKEWSCQPFAVANPFFGGQPYRIFCAGENASSVTCDSSRQVAVFGVVDPDLPKDIGLLNYSWLNDDPGFDTVVSAADVKDSLKQVLELCNQDSSCKDAPKVLMAQMSPARASALIASFKTTFDAVLSEADAELHTGNVNLTESDKCSTKNVDGPQFVITPPDPASIGGANQGFRPQVSRADITAHQQPQQSPRSGDPRDDRLEWLLANKVFAGHTVKEEATPAQSSEVTLEKLSKAALSAHGIASPADQRPHPPVKLEGHSDPLQQLTLAAMREHYGTDIAFLQKRDFYDADELSNAVFNPQRIQDQIDKILWKSDFETVLHVTGATLRKLVAQSDKFQELDDNGLSTAIEKGRSLVMLGLFKDPKDSSTFYVNGMKMNDATLYSVAATDYLAAGDTGYSDLATPDVPPAPRLKDFKDLRLISGLVCDRIVSYSQVGYCNNDEFTLAYFDPASAKPADDTKGFTTGQHYATSLARIVRRPDSPSFGVENNAQQRHFWSLDLNNLDFAFSGTFIDRLRNVQRNFAGISATGVTSAGSSSYGADHYLRLTYDYGQGTFYWLTDSAFSRTTATTPLNQGWSPPSIAENYWGLESGGTLRFPWRQKRARPYWLSLEYAIRYEPEIIQPAPSQISPAPDLGLSTTLFWPTPKSDTIYGRVGLRADHDDTYFEAGVQYADFRYVLNQYQFSGLGTVCKPSAADQFDCGPTFQSAATAIASDAALFTADAHPSQVATTSYLDPGVYLNFNLKFPILSRMNTSNQDQSWYFVLTNKGNFFFNSRDDTSVQTRYLNKLSPSFNIPIYGKLMLTPRMDVILYENKVVGKHYVALQPSLTLSYSFHWRQGMGLARAFGYGAINTTPPISIPPP